MLIAGLVLVLVELLVAVAAGLHRLVRAPSQRRPLAWIWLTWHVLPVWWGWRLLAGRVLSLAGVAAVRVCERHDRAQAVATYPPVTPGV